MNFIYNLFNACADIMRTSIDLFGYKISIMNVLIFVIVAFALWKVVKHLLS